MCARDLEVLGDRASRKCEKLEAAVAEEEQLHWRNVAKLLDANLVRDCTVIRFLLIIAIYLLI